MGDRGQVLVLQRGSKDAGVYLYTHWGASDLVQDVEKAIAKKWRWNDPDYLARIIFDVMTAECHGEETGYGIGIEMAGDIWRLVKVDCDAEAIEVIDNGHCVYKKTFEEIANATTAS